MTGTTALPAASTPLFTIMRATSDSVGLWLGTLGECGWDEANMEDNPGWEQSTVSISAHCAKAFYLRLNICTSMTKGISWIFINSARHLSAAFILFGRWYASTGTLAERCCGKVYAKKSILLTVWKNNVTTSHSNFKNVEVPVVEDDSLTQILYDLIPVISVTASQTLKNLYVNSSANTILVRDGDLSCILALARW